MAFDKQSEIRYPFARSEHLVIQNVGDETVVYDEASKTAHALKPLAAAVFMYADGNNSIGEIAELASYRLNRAIAENDVKDAVAELDACALLQSAPGLLEQGVSRRTALKAFAAAGAGTMLVSSVAAPFASATTLSNYGNPYSCAYVDKDGAIADSGTDANQSGDPTVSGSKAPNGWPQPYVKQSGSGGNAKFAMATGKTAGAPVTAGDYVLGANCYAAVSGSTYVYGTYQTVPCDGSVGAGYSCSDVVCVPTSTSGSNDANNGNLLGTSNAVASVIAGAVTSGPIYVPTGSTFSAPSGVISGYSETINGTKYTYNGYGDYTDYDYPTQYYFKVCCADGSAANCGHNNS